MGPPPAADGEQPRSGVSSRPMTSSASQIQPAEDYVKPSIAGGNDESSSSEEKVYAGEDDEYGEQA
ncbi:MAG: hypothetical protein Q9198_009146, partial [Flavoplaca austrocitrina]